MTANCLCSAPRGEHYLNCPANTFPTAAEPDAGDVEALTEAEREALFTRARELSVSRDTAILETVVGRILAARLAAVRREAEVKALTEAADEQGALCHCPIGVPEDDQCEAITNDVERWLRDRAARLGGA